MVDVVDASRAGPGPDETIAWEGRSERGLTLNAFDAPLMAAGLLLAIIGSGMVAKGGFVVGLPVLLIGCYLFAGQLLFESYRRRRTRYVLTTDHAYLLHSWPRHRTTVIDLRRCGPVTLTRHRDGTETITFGRARALVTWVGPARWARPAFRYLAEAEALMPVIRGEADRVEVADLSAAPDGEAGS